MNTNEVHITVLSQAPFKNFGDIIDRGIAEVNETKSTIDNIEDSMGLGAYKGDGKDLQFTPNRNASARLKFTTDINLDTRQVIAVECTSPNGTLNLTSGEFDKAKPEKYATLNPNNNTLNFDYSGSNPIAVGAPDIDVKGNLQFTNEENGNLHIKGALYGDEFPTTSAFIHFTEENKNGVMLGSAPLEVGISKDTGVLFKLPGEGNMKIMNIDLSIKFDKNHLPTHVTNLVNNKTYSVKEWNTLHREKPMITPSSEMFQCSTSEMFVDDHVTCEKALLVYTVSKTVKRD